MRSGWWNHWGLEFEKGIGAGDEDRDRHPLSQEKVDALIGVEPIEMMAEQSLGEDESRQDAVPRALPATRVAKPPIDEKVRRASGWRDAAPRR